MGEQSLPLSPLEHTEALLCSPEMFSKWLQQGECSTSSPAANIYYDTRNVRHKWVLTFNDVISKPKLPWLQGSDTPPGPAATLYFSGYFTLISESRTLRLSSGPSSKLRFIRISKNIRQFLWNQGLSSVLSNK